jgi:hypothetical protein
MSIKLHKVIHCFDSLIILLYEHPFTIYFDTHRRHDNLDKYRHMERFFLYIGKHLSYNDVLR